MDTVYKAGARVGALLKEKGHTVAVIERLPDIMTDVIDLNRLMLYKMMTDNNVQVVTNAQVSKIVNDVVFVKQASQETHLPAEILVIATGMSSCNQLHKALINKVSSLYAVGDCVKPGRIIHAFWDAFHTVHRID